MVVDVVGSDRCPRNAPQKIIFFVGGPIRSIKSNCIRPIFLASGGQPRGRLFQSLLPTGWLEPAGRADQRLIQRRGMASDATCERAFGRQTSGRVACKFRLMGAAE